MKVILTVHFTKEEKELIAKVAKLFYAVHDVDNGDLAEAYFDRSYAPTPFEELAGMIEEIGNITKEE